MLDLTSVTVNRAADEFTFTSIWTDAKNKCRITIGGLVLADGTIDLRAPIADAGRTLLCQRVREHIAKIKQPA